MEAGARAQLASEGFPEDRVGLRRSADCRYQGQSFELTVPVTDGPIDAGALAALAEALGREHERTYGHRAGAEEPVEIVNLRVVAHGVSDRPRVPERIRIDRSGGGDRPTWRVYFGAGLGWRETPILDRPALATPRVGPCVIEEYDATCVVPPGGRATLDAYGNIAIDLGADGRAGEAGDDE
jgi:N-methylhydantoinase A